VLLNKEADRTISHTTIIIIYMLCMLNQGPKREKGLN